MGAMKGNTRAARASAAFGRTKPAMQQWQRQRTTRRYIEGCIRECARCSQLRACEPHAVLPCLHFNYQLPQLSKFSRRVPCIVRHPASVAGFSVALSQSITPALCRCYLFLAHTAGTINTTRLQSLHVLSSPVRRWNAPEAV